MVSVPSQMNPIHTLTHYLFKIHLNTHPWSLRSSLWFLFLRFSGKNNAYIKMEPRFEMQLVHNVSPHGPLQTAVEPSYTVNQQTYSS
jgi:hypothetical protein